MDGHFGFGLPSEEGIVEFLVIDVDFPHLGSHLLPHLSLQVLLIFLLKDITYQHTSNKRVMELKLLYNQLCTSLSQHPQSIKHPGQKTFITACIVQVLGIKVPYFKPVKEQICTVVSTTIIEHGST